MLDRLIISILFILSEIETHQPFQSVERPVLFGSILLIVTCLHEIFPSKSINGSLNRTVNER